MASISCSICSESYNSQDEVYSTNCGHLFHFQCMQQWKSRSLSCPQCRSYDPPSHKVYLNFEECALGYNQTSLEWKSKLDYATATKKTLKEQLEVTEKELFNIQALWSASENRVKDLNGKIDYLTLQNEGREKEIEKLKKEILKQNQCEADNENEEKITQDNGQGVVIRNVRVRSTNENYLIDAVLRLAKQMNLFYKRHQIKSVFLLERKDSELITLLVKFASLNLEMQFLEYKNLLKRESETKELIIHEYIGDVTNSYTLWQYAKLLKGVGYKTVYMQNHRVFAKLHKKSQSILITHKEQVDMLMEEANTTDESDDEYIYL